MISKKQLEVYLSKLKQIKEPKVNIEQYQTPSNIAAEVLWTAYMSNDVKGKIIADLGCGNGILGIGALKLKAAKVFLLDIDQNAVLTTKENIKRFRSANLLCQELKYFNKQVDTTIQNPPFGVQNEHADRPFLIKAMELSNKIYSFHKLESEDFIKAIAKDSNFILEHILKFKFPLKKTQKFHKKTIHEVKVGCFILSRNV